MLKRLKKAHLKRLQVSSMADETRERSDKARGLATNPAVFIHSLIPPNLNQKQQPETIEHELRCMVVFMAQQGIKRKDLIEQSGISEAMIYRLFSGKKRAHDARINTYLGVRKVLVNNYGYTPTF